MTRIPEGLGLQHYRQALSSHPSTGPTVIRSCLPTTPEDIRLDRRPGSNWKHESRWAFSRMPHHLVALLSRAKDAPPMSGRVAGVYTAVLIGPLSGEGGSMTTPACLSHCSHIRRARLPLFCPPHLSATNFFMQASGFAFSLAILPPFHIF